MENQRLAVIENIKNAVEDGDFNRKVEIGDPILTEEQREELIANFDNLKKKLKNKAKAYVARNIVDLITETINQDTEIIGLEKLKGMESGAILTSNHFSKVDNTVIRYLLHRIGRGKHFYIIIQETNILMPGSIGWLLRNCYTMPLSKNAEYMTKNFAPALEKLLKQNEYVLIYPEEEMWYNYRKPRPHKIGAYHYAAKFNVPIIPCFIEIREKDTVGDDGFYDLKFKLHILDPIYPDSSLGLKESKELMRKKDYAQRVEAYERIYGKKLTDEFNLEEDIAGWRK